jgi:4-hydroxy-3-methylbut-2-enyl diphosphate reductase
MHDLGQEIRHFDNHRKEEVATVGWLPEKSPLSVGIPAGASCPNNLIEETINRILALRNEDPV